MMRSDDSGVKKLSVAGERALAWIAGYNVAKGMLFLAIGLGALKFLHKDVDEIVARWIAAAGISLEHAWVVALLKRLDVLTSGELWAVSGVAFLLAAVFFTEGIGLFYRRRWAEYLTVVVTASFVPFEVFEILKKFGPIKAIVLVINLVILFILVRVLRAKAVE